jgi:hypothetical protein
MPQISCYPLGGLELGQGVKILFGAGDPNAQNIAPLQSAALGSLYLRTDGSTSTSLYVKTATGIDATSGLPNAGTWTAK